MSDLFRHLKAAWYYGRTFPYLESADAADYWGVDEEAELARFFNSRTGRKLSKRLTNFILKKAMFNANNPQATQYDNGLTAGLSAMIAAIQSHFPAASPNTGESEDSDEAAPDILERHAA